MVTVTLAELNLACINGSAEFESVIPPHSDGKLPPLPEPNGVESPSVSYTTIWDRQ